MTIDDTGNFYEGYTLLGAPLFPNTFVEPETGNRNIPAYRLPSFQMAYARGADFFMGDAGSIPPYLAIPDGDQWSWAQQDNDGESAIPLLTGTGTVTVDGDGKGWSSLDTLAVFDQAQYLSDDESTWRDSCHSKMKIFGPTFGVITVHQALSASVTGSCTLLPPSRVLEIILHTPADTYEISAPTGNEQVPDDPGGTTGELNNAGVAIFWIGIHAADLPYFDPAGIHPNFPTSWQFFF